MTAQPVAPRRASKSTGRLLGQAPVGARGARRGPQAPGHVHRLHRRPRPHALPLGDHRQLRRRGARRPLPPHRRRAVRRRLGRGPRRRPRHPGRRRAQDAAHRRRGRHDQAARRRQVRRRLLHRLGRPARRRRVGGQRALRAPRHRGRPRRQDPHDVVPARRPRPVRRRRPRRRVHEEVRPRRRRPRQEGRHRHPHALLGRPADLHQGRRVRRRGAARPRAADRVPRARARRSRSATSAARRSSDETYLYKGGITEFVEYLSRTRRVTGVLRLKGSGPLQGDRAGPRRQGPHDLAGGRARARRRRRAALGHRLRHRRPQLRQHHRHAQGRHPRAAGSTAR